MADAYGTTDQFFNQNSPWNTKIGSGAQYQSSTGAETKMMRDGAGTVTWIAADAMEVGVAKSTDPLVTWHIKGLTGNAREFGAYDYAPVDIQLRTPTDFDFHTGDGWGVLVMPDGKHYVESWLGTRNADGSITASFAAENAMDGSGISAAGRHDGIRAAGFSLAGGLITEHDVSTGVIDHAVAMAIGTSMLKAGTDQSQQFVWPAASADSYSVGSYHGNIPMGSMFAIPKSVNVDALPISADGKMLAHAMQDYGAYVSDATDDRTASIATVETGVRDSFTTNLFNDMEVIRDQLSLVANNTQATPGGGGTVTPPSTGGGTTTPPTTGGGTTTPPPATGGYVPQHVEAGKGPDTLTLRMQEDAYKGDAKFTVKVDGKQVGGVFEVHAPDAGNVSDEFLIHGNWGKGKHSVSVSFVNDYWEGTDAKDRNLILDSAAYNGKELSGDHHEFFNNESFKFGFTDTGVTAAAKIADMASSNLFAVH